MSTPQSPDERLPAPHRSTWQQLLDDMRAADAIDDKVAIERCFRFGLGFLQAISEAGGIESLDKADLKRLLAHASERAIPRKTY